MIATVCRVETLDFQLCSLLNRLNSTTKGKRERFSFVPAFAFVILPCSILYTACHLSHYTIGEVELTPSPFGDTGTFCVLNNSTNRKCVRLLNIRSNGGDLSWDPTKFRFA